MLAEPLQKLQERFPQVEIGSYPGFARAVPAGQVVLRSVDADALEEATMQAVDFVKALGGNPILLGDGSDATQAA